MNSSKQQTKKKPRVLHLLGSFQKGGSETQAVQLIKLLHAGGCYEVFAATMDKSGPLGPQLESLGLDEVPEFRLTSFYNLSTLVQLRRFVKHLKANNIDVVHTHDFYTNIFGMAASFLAGVPVRIAARRESAMRAPFKRLMERFFYRAADVVVANCKEVERQLEAEGVPKRKLTTIYNGVDLRHLSKRSFATNGETARHFRLPTSPSRIVTIVANLRHSVKDHPTFLRAAREIANALPDTLFVIAGEGELMKAMRTLAIELGIDKNTFFLGRCDQIADLLSITEIGVLCSVSEGFPNSILEYMAAGCPVIATNVGGISEAVVDGETGYLVAARSPDLLADKILLLLHNPGRAREMGNLGRQLVKGKFSDRRQLQSTQALYAELLTTAVARLSGSLTS